MTNRVLPESTKLSEAYRLHSRSGCLRSLSFQLLSASGVLALALAAVTAPLDSALADCTASATSTSTNVVCSGNSSGTSDQHYWVPDDKTKASVEVQSGASMGMPEAAIRIGSGSSVTIDNGATVNVTGDNSQDAFNALYIGGDNSSITNNGTVSTHKDEVDGLEATGNGNTFVNKGQLSTEGLSSEAMIARGSNNTLSNSGTITTTGINARGGQ